MILRIPARLDEPCPYGEGAELAMAVPGLEGKPRVRINRVSRQVLSTVTWQEIRAEVGNHRSRRGYEAAWVRKHDRSWRRRHPTGSDEDAAMRFRSHWQNQTAWVIRFVLLETPRLLAAQRDILAGRTSDGEYVRTLTLTIDREAEGVDGATLDRFAADVAPVSEAQRAVERRQRYADRQRFRNARVAMLRDRS